MWGEPVNIPSSEAKKISSSEALNRKYIGNKIDFRICYKDYDKLVNLLNGEIVKQQTDGNKYYHDHTELSHEAKIVADSFYVSPFVKNKDKKSLKVCGLQIAAVEGEIVEIRLVDKGLYVFSNLDSLRLPVKMIFAASVHYWNA